MSIELMNVARKRVLGSSNRKQMMIELADRASDNGEGCYMSIATLVKQTEMSRNTVRKILREFVSEGLLTEHGIHNQYQTQIYNISVKALTDLPHVDGGVNFDRGSTDATEGGSTDAGEGGSVAHPKPNKTKNKPARTRASREAGSRLSELLGSHIGPDYVGRVTELLIKEAEAFDGHRILVTSRFMADRLSEALGKILKANNLKITTNPDKMQLEERTTDETDTANQ